MLGEDEVVTASNHPQHVRVSPLERKGSATRARLEGHSPANKLFLKMQDTLMDISRQVGVSRRDDGSVEDV